MSDYNSDLAVKEPEHDEFQRYPFAKRIAQTILGSSSPDGFVIGIYGAWGEGKSSVLEFISSEIEASKSQDVVTIKFNPWRFGDEVMLLTTFFNEIANALGEKTHSWLERGAKVVKKNESVADESSDVIQAILNYGDFVAATVKPFIPGVGLASETLKKVSGAIGNVSLEKVKGRIEKYLKEHKKRIVVIIDDVDRLEWNEIHAIFRLIKLTANFKYTVYVLAFDNKLVAEVLSAHYNGNVDRGHDYLEKIIQVPLQLPAIPDQYMLDFCIAKLRLCLQENNVVFDLPTQERVENCLRSGLLPGFNTPRTVLRFINSCTFTIPLMHGLVNTGDLILMEGVKQLYPDLYTFIRNNPNNLVTRNGRIVVHSGKLSFEGKFKSVLDKYGVGAYDIVMNLFPECLKHLEKPMFFSEPDITNVHRDMRVCSEEFFDRYFTYGVLKGDMPDYVLDETIVSLGNDLEKNATSLEELFRKYGASTVIHKLRQKESLYDQSQSLFLAQALPKLAFHCPRTLDFGWHTLPGRLAQLIIILVKKLPDLDQDQILFDAATKCRPLNFGFEVRDFMIKDTQKNFKESALLIKINKGLLDEHIRITPDLEIPGEFPFDSRLLLMYWSENYNADFQVRIKQILETNPIEALKVIKSFTGFHITQSGDGKVYSTELTIDTFKFLKTFISPELIATAIVKAWGKDFEDPAYATEEYPFGVLTDEMVLKQFMFHYNKENTATQTS